MMELMQRIGYVLMMFLFIASTIVGLVVLIRTEGGIPYLEARKKSAMRGFAILFIAIVFFSIALIINQPNEFLSIFVRLLCGFCLFLFLIGVTYLQFILLGRKKR